MKHIDIVIATRNRYEKLMRTIWSIPEQEFITTRIVFDGDIDGFNNFHHADIGNRKWGKDIIPALGRHRGAVYWRNRLATECKDGLLYATDDMTFEPNSIGNALVAFNAHFPDDDGVVGFVQIPDNFHPTGVALVGQKFLRRYPKKQLFNPEYFHFACQEVYWLASKLGRFHQEPTAVIRHYHPVFFKNEMDETHREARIHREKDHALMRERQTKGLIWGDA